MPHYPSRDMYTALDLKVSLNILILASSIKKIHGYATASVDTSLVQLSCTTIVNYSFKNIWSK